MLDNQKEVRGGESAPHRWSNLVQSRLVVVLFGLVVVAFLLSGGVVLLYTYNFDGALSKEHQVWGTFGDFLGGILNPLLSLLALIALLLTIVLQSDELRLSREELSLTREELKKSADAQEKAQRALTQQLENSIAASRLEYLNVLAQAEFRILQRLREPRTIRAREMRKRTIDKLLGHEKEISEFAARFERSREII